MDQWIFTAIGVAVVCVIAFWRRRSGKTRGGFSDNNAGDANSTFNAADFSWGPGHHHSGASGDFGGHHGASGDFGGGDSGGGHH